MKYLKISLFFILALLAFTVSVAFSQPKSFQKWPIVSSWSCPKCGEKNPDIITWCDYCGSSR